jgi:phospholipase/lecithinase/hemolysin
MSTAPDFDRLVYFGDSLTDTGQVFDLTSRTLIYPLPTALYGYDGKFSDGDIYAEGAPGLLGIDPANVTNYAVGGARAVGVRTYGDYLAANGAAPLLVPSPPAENLAFDLNLGGQVARFLADAAEAGGVAPNTAASLLIGLNDFSSFQPSSEDPTVVLAEALALLEQMVQSVAGAALALAQAGVSTIFVNTRRRSASSRFSASPHRSCRRWATRPRQPTTTPWSGR